MDPRASNAIAGWNRTREAILSDFPELSEDLNALQDTLDGETDALDVAAGMIRAAQRRYAMAEGLRALQQDMADRKARLADGGDKLMEAAQSMMDAIGVRKMERPDFTAWLRATPPKVQIIDEGALPDRAWRTTRAIDKTEIKKLLAEGLEVPGAALTNGGESLTVRTK